MHILNSFHLNKNKITLNLTNFESRIIKSPFEIIMHIQPIFATIERTIILNARLKHTSIKSNQSHKQQQ